MKLPIEAYERRPDGKCARCEQKKALGRDSLFCGPCGAYVRGNPPETGRTITGRGAEHVGRPARDPKALGGAPAEMRPDDD